MTYSEIQTKIDSFARPEGFRPTAWRALKKMAFIIWEEHLNGTGWRGAVKVPCKEFYFMLLNENGNCVVPYQSQLIWTDTDHNRNYVNELNEQGLQQAKMGLLDRAQMLFDRALNILPYSYETLCYKGWIQQKTKLYQAAMESFEKAVHIAPDKAMAFHLRSKLYSLLDMDDRAMEDMNRAVRNQPDSAAFLARRAELQELLNNPAGALFDIKLAIQLQPNSIKLRWNLAVLLEKQGHLKSAIQAYEIITKMDPNNAEAKYYLAVLMAKEQVAPVKIKEMLSSAKQLGHVQAEQMLFRLFPNQRIYTMAA